MDCWVQSWIISVQKYSRFIQQVHVISNKKKKNKTDSLGFCALARVKLNWVNLLVLRSTVVFQDTVRNETRFFVNEVNSRMCHQSGYVDVITRFTELQWLRDEVNGKTRTSKPTLLTCTVWSSSNWLLICRCRHNPLMRFQI